MSQEVEDIQLSEDFKKFLLGLADLAVYATVFVIVKNGAGTQTWRIARVGVFVAATLIATSVVNVVHRDLLQKYFTEEVEEAEPIRIVPADPIA